jgi:hypothetical protein
VKLEIFTVVLYQAVAVLAGSLLVMGNGRTIRVQINDVPPES